ncbi:hypothetical protein WS90_09455 [Burkholderia cepacia]|uniref:HTH hxlR-type domain-containing protein n=1 Tax=Burkholderia cepacia TaxID=292 RepID=A0A103ZSG6_BURCE|nr:winged helix-turn-helix transcriptional regulator [Burkholderia cepacia]KVK85288.1 hypothetical protein WS90_09455 [Burkholderia cepacia]
MRGFWFADLSLRCSIARLNVRRPTRPDERRLDDDLSDGIGTRTVFAEVPPRVEYALTEFGRTLVSVLNAMTQWDDAYLA